MGLFNIINLEQNYRKIKIQKDVLKTNPSWKKHFLQIETINHQDIKVNIYSHTYVDFFKIFKNLEFNYYLLEKEKDSFLTAEKYIDERYCSIFYLINIIFANILRNESA